MPNPSKDGARRPARSNLTPRQPWGVIAAGVLVVAGTITGLIVMALQIDQGRAQGNAAAAAFQREHWRTPIPLQGPPAADVLPQAAGLHPEDCGACHPQQFADWRESLHAAAMGPGVVGQFPTMSVAAQTECQTCHAPMSEQWPRLPGAGAANAAFDASLRAKGVVCSACHLRGHRRHGPPADPERVAAGTDKASAVIHGEPVRTPHFRASEFCMGCHQHGPETQAVNGKPVENTYREWLESPAAREGRTCQSCHMPGGRHLWRGIHDAGMTRSGVAIRADVEPDAPVAGAPLRARLELENTGGGHAFPTYTTPAVFLRAALLDAEGNVLPGYFEEHLIQRRLDMSTAPWGEHFDTRLQPGERAVLSFARTVPPEAASVYLWVWVEPDHFYTGFYRAYLQGGGDFDGAAQLAKALDNAQANAYRLFGRQIPVQRAH